MSDIQIFKLALDKAQDNGFTSNLKLYPDNLIKEDQYQVIIFSHDFAKAFWGEEEIEVEIEVGPEGGMVYEFYRLPAWQYHLQQMVLKEEPLKYLEQFLEKGQDE